MPAAAVIPAPVAYINVVAVKKLVVGFLADLRGPQHLVFVSTAVRRLSCTLRLASVGQTYSFTLKKLECSKQAFCIEYISME